MFTVTDFASYIQNISTLKNRLWFSDEEKKEFEHVLYEQNRSSQSLCIVGLERSGKKSMVKHIIKQCYSSVKKHDDNDDAFTFDILNNTMLILDDDSGKGIDVIRSRVNPFVRTMQSDKNKIKIIVIYNIDKYSLDAQKALMTTFELPNVVFICTCEDENSLTAALRSRLRCIRIKRVSGPVVLNYFMSIIKEMPSSKLGMTILPIIRNIKPNASMLNDEQLQYLKQFNSSNCFFIDVVVPIFKNHIHFISFSEIIESITMLLSDNISDFIDAFLHWGQSESKQSIQLEDCVSQSELWKQFKMIKNLSISLTNKIGERQKTVDFTSSTSLINIELVMSCIEKMICLTENEQILTFLSTISYLISVLNYDILSDDEEKEKMKSLLACISILENALN